MSERGKKRGSAKGLSLAGREHRLYRLAPDLLLVFKPRGHREQEHEHERGQRLRVLRGELTVQVGQRTRVLRPGRAALTVPARRAHRTRAGKDTWLVVEWLGEPPGCPPRQPATKSR